MFRIAAVSKNDQGQITSVIVDVETALGKNEEAAKTAFIIKHAEELAMKEVILVVHPF